MPGVPAKLSRDAGLGARAWRSRHRRAPAWSPRHARPPRRPAATTARPPLAGIRVLDLGTRDRRRLRRRHPGQPRRRGGQGRADRRRSFRSDGGGFIAYNRGKRGLGVDLKQPAGRRALPRPGAPGRRGARQLPPGRARAAGHRLCGAAAVNPRIISCSINTYGDRGDRRTLPGFDPLLQAAGRHDGGAGRRRRRAGVPHHRGQRRRHRRHGRLRRDRGAERARDHRRGPERRDQPDGPEPDLPAGRTDHLCRPAAQRRRRRATASACARCTASTCARDGWLAIVCERPDEARAVGRVLGVDIGDAGPGPDRAAGWALADALAAAFATRPRDETVQALLAAGVARRAGPARPEAFDERLAERERPVRALGAIRASAR